MNEIDELFKDFEKKFGFKTYQALTHFFGSLRDKIVDLTKSRDTWKHHYLELKELYKGELKKQNENKRRS